MNTKNPKKIRDSILAGVIASFLVLITFVSCSELMAFGQTEIPFTPSNEFLIPTTNGTISFAVNGTYQQAKLENDFWNFVNLRLDNRIGFETVNLKVSAHDSAVSIRSCFIYNGTFADSRVLNSLLSYGVEGYGKQIFNLGLGSDKGDWSVIVNGEFIGKDHGWTLTPEGTLTVKNTAQRVTLAYYGFPTSYVESENGSVQSFLNDHSVTITTLVVVAITLVVATAINAKNKKRMT